MTHSITIRDSWDEVTIAEYLEIKELLESQGDELDQEIRILCVLSGKQEDDFNHLYTSDIKKMFQASSFIYNEPTKINLQDYYHIGGVTYKLCKNPEKICAGQAVDLMTLLASEDRDKRMHELIATLLLPTKPLSILQRLYNKMIRFISSTAYGREQLRKKRLTQVLPITEKYRESDLNIHVENILNNMNVIDAHSISVFFYLVGNGYAKVTQAYLEVNLMTKLKSQLMTLENSEVMKTKKGKKLMEKIQKEIGIIESGAGWLQSIN